MLKNLIDIMDDQDSLKDFVNLVKGLASKKINGRNIAVLCALDVGKYYALESTTQMRFRSECLEWWELSREIGGSKIIRLFQGGKHFHSVTGNTCDKGKYPPTSGEVNFIVPDEQILSKSTTGIPKKIKPGFIEESVQLLDSSKSYVLSIDGKKVTPELGNEIGDGDVN